MNAYLVYTGLERLPNSIYRSTYIYIWFISQINKEKKYSPVRYDTFGYGLQSDFFSAIVKVFDMMMVT